MRKARRKLIILGCVVVVCVIVFHFQFQRRIEKERNLYSNQDVNEVYNFRTLPEKNEMNNNLHLSVKLDHSEGEDKLISDQSPDGTDIDIDETVRKIKAQESQRNLDDSFLPVPLSNLNTSVLQISDNVSDSSLRDFVSRVYLNLNQISSHSSNLLHRNSYSSEMVALNKTNQSASVESTGSLDKPVNSHSIVTRTQEPYKDSHLKIKLTDRNGLRFSSLSTSASPTLHSLSLDKLDKLSRNGINITSNINNKNKRKNISTSSIDSDKEDLQHINADGIFNAEKFAKDTFAEDTSDFKKEALPMKPFTQLHPMKSKENSSPNDLENKNVNSQLAKGKSSMSNVEEGIKIVSMSLYGTNRRYIVGALRNAELIIRYFPGWTLRIYAISPASTSASKHPPLSSDVVESLRNLGADIQYVTPELDFVPPMMWRFLVADDLSVERFIVRDSDSRLSERDAACVAAWTQSDKAFLSIRDHPSHAGYAISGGLWGGCPAPLRNILRRSWLDLMKGLSADYLSDMNFLNDIVWPKVKDWHLHSCDSVSCDKWPSAFPFPVERRGYEHVGAVYNEHDLVRPEDAKILLRAETNVNCLPNNTISASVRLTEVLKFLRR